MFNSETERCREAERFRKIDAAFRAGDLEALRAAVGGSGLDSEWTYAAGNRTVS